MKYDIHASHASFTVSVSRTSPIIISMSSAIRSRFANLPELRSSKTTTDQPVFKSRSAICDPMNPAPPVQELPK